MMMKTTIRPGTHLRYQQNDGSVVEYTVAVIRRFPFPFAELRSPLGGPPRTVRLSEIE